MKAATLRRWLVARPEPMRRRRRPRHAGAGSQEAGGEQAAARRHRGCWWMMDGPSSARTPRGQRRATDCRTGGRASRDEWRGRLSPVRLPLARKKRLGGRRPSAGPWRQTRSGWHSRARRRSPPSAAARRQRHRARQQHLLAPLHERGAELAAEQPGDRSRARPGVAGPRLEGGVARRIVEHGCAQAPQPLSAAGRCRADRRGPAQLVDKQGGDRFSRARLSRSAGGPHRRVGHRARAPGRAAGSRPRAPGTGASAPPRPRCGRARGRPVMDVEGQKLGVLDHRHACSTPGGIQTARDGGTM